MSRRGWRREPARHSLAARGVHSARHRLVPRHHEAPKKEPEEWEKLWMSKELMQAIIDQMNASDAVRQLEKKARAQRPPGASRTAPLTNFLLPDEAQQLRIWRERLKDARAHARGEERNISDKLQEKGYMMWKDGKYLRVYQQAKIVGVEKVDGKVNLTVEPVDLRKKKNFVEEHMEGEDG